ncbi:MAG: DUF1566 domain-containing protein [Bdellovibrionales bacterium]|nr:DUF1566 domain-containing protein [Bdellovibrionales bacterium]
MLNSEKDPRLSTAPAGAGLSRATQIEDGISFEKSRKPVWSRLSSLLVVTLCRDLLTSVDGFVARNQGVRYALLFLSFVALKAFATPKMVRIDGSVFDSMGSPITENRDIRIKAYDAATGGTLLWTSDVYNATINVGRFTINLDAASGSSPSLVTQVGERTAGQGIYFQVEVDSGAADGSITPGDERLVLPRIRSKGTMFALSAAQADSIKGVTVSSAELNYLAGVTASLQSQIESIVGASGGLQKSGDTMTGPLGLEYGAVTPSRFMMVDSARRLVSSSSPVTDAEFGYLAGVTSSIAAKINSFGATEAGYMTGVTGAIQTQLNSLSTSLSSKADASALTSVSNSVVGKLDRAGDTMTGALGLNTVTPSRFLMVDSARKIVSSANAVTDTEFSYLSGVTSNIGAKLNKFTATEAGYLTGLTTTIAPNLNGVTANIQTQLNVLKTSNGGTPNAFSFNNQTGVSTNVTVTSNAVALSGFSGALVSACSGCTDIVKNGVSQGAQFAVFLSGDTVAIKQQSSGSYGTQTTASITVGATQSGTWSVTTLTNQPEGFSFTDQTGVTTSTTITSNAITLAGVFPTATATCGPGCTEISRNGGGFSAGPVGGFESGDTIAIRQTSSASEGTPTTATVTIGGITSSVWTVTTLTSDPCNGSPSIGTVCADGSVYAGTSPDGSVPMYAMRCDIGMSWNGSSCTGSATTKTWNDGSSNWVTTSVTSTTAGETNTGTLVALGTTPSPAPYNAARACGVDSSGAHGRTDWYLPAKDELNVLYTNMASIGGFSATLYWSSTEFNNNFAWRQNFSSGSQNASSKDSGYRVRCVRR